MRAPWIALLALLPAVAAAQEPLVPAAVDPCGEDVVRLCPGVKPGEGRVVGCLRKHESELGEACRERVQAQVERARRFVQEFGQACKPDVDRWCPAIDPGQGRVLGCLGQHLPDLTGPCQAQLERLYGARDRVAAFRRACAPDVERLCSGSVGDAGDLVACLEERKAQISPECRATDFRAAAEAAVVQDLVEEMTSRERIRESLEILQGLDSVAFSRSQVLLQFDGFQSIADRANGGRLLFNPQFVFGEQGQFSLQVKVPVTALYPYAPGAPTQFGLGAVSTGVGWSFLRTGPVRHFAALALQWQTASSPPVGGPWAVVPAYAFGLGLARWVSLTTQVVWFRSFGGSGSYADVNLLYVEPIVAFNLPGRSYLALDTRLGWSFTSGTFVPIMKGVAGIFLDRQKSVSVSAWYQAALSQPAADQFFKYGFGMGLAYFFDF